MIMNLFKECGLDSAGSRWDPLLGCCACGNEQPELRHASTNTRIASYTCGNCKLLWENL